MKFLATTKITRSTPISTDKEADQLVWRATTAPDVDWTSGFYYLERKSKTARAATTDNAIALWEEFEHFLAKR